MEKPRLNRFLQTRAEIDECTEHIKQNNLTPHGLSCKDFDIWNICNHLTDGNLLDMGSSGSWILENAFNSGIKGRKVGIDLGYEKDQVTDQGIELFKGDLMNTPFESGSFQNVCCLSVVEHQVNFNLLAKECARLLKPGGKLFMTFDFWNPKVNTEGLKLYNLEWNILDKSDVLKLVDACDKNGMKLVGDEIDWTTNEAVINPTYCSPFPGISYTFGIIIFEKK